MLSIPLVTLLLVFCSLFIKIVESVLAGEELFRMRSSDLQLSRDVDKLNELACSIAKDFRGVFADCALGLGMIGSGYWFGYWFVGGAQSSWCLVSMGVAVGLMCFIIVTRFVPSWNTFMATPSKRLKEDDFSERLPMSYYFIVALTLSLAVAIFTADYSH